MIDDFSFFAPGTDEAAIIEVLGYRISRQRAQVVKLFKTMFGKVGNDMICLCGTYVLVHLVNVINNYCRLAGWLGFAERTRK